jgi:hypothetical protein
MILNWKTGYSDRKTQSLSHILGILLLNRLVPVNESLEYHSLIEEKQEEKICNLVPYIHGQQEHQSPQVKGRSRCP